VGGAGRLDQHRDDANHAELLLTHPAPSCRGDNVRNAGELEYKDRVRYSLACCVPDAVRYFKARTKPITNPNIVMTEP
jgi:hypothetical protein